KDGNIVSISNDFTVFMKENTNLKESNIVIKILKTMCNDANNGICHNPSLYLSNFRAILRKFILWVLLGSHVPLIILLFNEFMPFAEIVKYQVCCYVLIYILEMALQYKYAQFIRFFYTNWYDKIVNFDLLTVSMIRNDTERIKKLSNSQDLLKAIDRFTANNTMLSGELSSQTAMLSSRLDEFLTIQQKTNGINAQTVLSSLDDCIKKFSAVYENMCGIVVNIENSLDSLTNLSKSKRSEINAINKNTDMLFELRERFKTYQSEAFSSELTHLQEITESLENNVSKAFVSIDSAVTQNFSRLETGYDRFFDMCKVLSESMSNKYEEKTISILTSLFNNLVSEFTAIRERMDKLSNVITGTSDATKVLCETVYDFTQYTLSPNFMGRIVNYANFSDKLKDAADKLISYQKLADLWDIAVNKQTISNTGKPENYGSMITDNEEMKK
ncbi:MAG: hypothetical protein LBU84_17765, partial [Prevotella sp.]|nr:hypothetical protein [Prevotella sp.]